MMRNLDRKTWLLGVTVTLAALVCIVFTAFNTKNITFPLVLSFTWIVSIFVIVQTNLDKAFLAKRIERVKREILQVEKSSTEQINYELSGLLEFIDKKHSNSTREVSAKLENSFEPKLDNVLSRFIQDQKKLEKKITYEIPYMTKSLVDALEQSSRNIIHEIGKTQQSNNAGLEKALRKFTDQTVLSDRNPSPLTRNMLTKNHSYNNESRDPSTVYGRGAAAVQADPERTFKIFSRLKLNREFRVFLLGSDQLELHLSNELGIQVTTLHPSAGGYEVTSALSETTSQVISIFIIEMNALDDGIWASSLSSSGTRLYRTIGEISGIIREKQGFSFLVGNGKSANTFSSSLESNVDACITTKEFEEDWAFDTELRIPRLLQDYLNEKEK
ncbi:hypothetical protein [Glutamicibacter sp. NPDC087673]|uniref:hypothetical protein n=1 Tax=Glutamicibacter sp. NPDC087673 TaxID=3363997 RepID=UPI00382828D3